MSPLTCYRCKQEYANGRCGCDDGITLIHGNCKGVLPELGAESVDMIFADPPYGHNNNDGDLISKREAALGVGDSPPETRRPIANDGPEANDLVRWFFGEAARLLRLGCCCCCCGGGGGPDPQFARWSLWLDEVIPFKQMVVWDKGPMGMGWHYRRSYEVVLVANKAGAACPWFGGKTTENVIRPGAYGIKKIIPSANQHPTKKPVALPGLFIGLHTESGALVFDPFAGSGTTGVACRDLGRRCLMIEIEQKYCEIAAQRLRQKVLF